jgi:hypothetical protein
MLFQSYIRRADRQTALMHRMFDRLGVDMARAAPRLLGSELPGVVRTCIACRNGAACDAWLSSGGSAGTRYAFCPNSARLDRILDAQEGRS